MSSPEERANESNRRIIEEFRASGGVVGGSFAGAPLLLLHTTGARSGEEWITPVMYQDVGEGRVAIFASKGGAPTHPDWYHNVVAHPEVVVEIGAQTRPARARIAPPEERGAIWSRQKTDFPNFADYEARTDREIPVVILELA
ncbi:MAG: nitroreductase family deazaflavin-dependent oxidoreductase [Acidimicrobiales bacterium]